MQCCFRGVFSASVFFCEEFPSTRPVMFAMPFPGEQGLAWLWALPTLVISSQSRKYFLWLSKNTICTSNFFKSFGRTGPHQKSHFLCNVIFLHFVFSHWLFCHSRLVSLVHGSFLSGLPCLTIFFLCLTVTCSTQLTILSGAHLVFVGFFFTSCQLISRNHRTSHLSILFSDKFIFNVQYQPYVLITTGCGDECRLSCEAFLRPWTLAQTFVPHR